MKGILKHILILSILPLFFGCAPRKCCPDQFGWKKGKPTPSEFQYNIALSEGNLIYTLGGTNHGAFESYDIQKKKWTSLPSLPTPVSFAGGVIWNHSIYLIGGIDSLLNYTSAFQKFDIIQNRWTNLPGLNTSRSRATAVVCQDKIYLIGGMTGRDDHHSQNSSLIEEYDPLKENWIKKTDMPTARNGLSSVVVESSKIIVAGGYTDSGETAIVEEYDPVTDRWSRKADMPTPNSFFGLIAMENSIYALGGKQYQNIVPLLKYDVNADQWTQTSSTPEIMNRFGITVAGNRIYIIGGVQNPHAVWVGKKV